MYIYLYLQYILWGSLELVYYSYLVGLFHLFTGRIQPANIGVINHVLSTLDIPVASEKWWLEDDPFFLGLVLTFRDELLFLGSTPQKLT